ncbi:MAG: ATP-dependent RNA helicase [Sphingobium sp.]|nr:MAG: ATP-dependent RNA helicase [Sphingobium sp.]
MWKKVIVTGLLAASALGAVSPSFAEPKDREQDGRWNRGSMQTRASGENQERWQRSRPQQQQSAAASERISVGQDKAQRPERWGWRGNANPAASERAAPQADNNRTDNDRMNNGRINNGSWNRDQRAPNDGDRRGWTTRDGGGERAVNRAGDRPAWQGRADNRPDRDRADWNRNGNRTENRPDWARRNDDRNGWNRNDWNRRDRIDDRQRWAGQRRWDSGWRSDRRYDWQRYRAQYRNVYRVGPYYAPRGWNYGYRPFGIGVYMDSFFYGNDYWLGDPWQYRLPPAYGSMRWIRYYDDALLVDIRDGYVVDVIRNFFW